MFILCILNDKCLLYSNICTNKYCKFILNYSAIFGVNTPSPGSLQVVLANVMNF